MRRLFRTSALGAVLILMIAAIASACSYAFPPAVVVDGAGSSTPWSLSDSDFQAALVTISGNKLLTNSLVGEQVDPFANPAKSAYNPAFVTGVLSVLVNVALQVDTAHGLDVSATPQELTTAKANLAKSFGGATTDRTTGQSTAGDPVAGAAAITSLGPIGDLLVEYVALQSGLQKATAPTEAQLRDVYEGAKGRLSEKVCASHILILGSKAETDPQTGAPPAPTDEEYAAALTKIEDIKKQLDAGGDFEALATSESEDPGSATKGGALDCVSDKGKFVKEFDDAIWSQPVGVVGPPVKTAYGYHLIKVTSRGVPTFEQVRDQIETAIGQDATQKVVAAQAKKATVTIDPRFGSWNVDEMRVVAPDSASDPTIPTTSTTFDPTALGSGSPAAADGSTAPSSAPSTTSTPTDATSTSTTTELDPGATGGSSTTTATVTGAGTGSSTTTSSTVTGAPTSSAATTTTR